jgi:hypothetical protein
MRSDGIGTCGASDDRQSPPFLVMALYADHSSLRFVHPVAGFISHRAPSHPDSRCQHIAIAFFAFSPAKSFCMYSVWASASCSSRSNLAFSRSRLRTLLVDGFFLPPFPRVFRHDVYQYLEPIEVDQRWDNPTANHKDNMIMRNWGVIRRLRNLQP